MSLVYNAGSFALQHRDVDYLSDEIHVILVASSYVPTLADTHAVLAAAEIPNVTGYARGFGGSGRRVVGSKTLVDSEATNRTVYDAADPAPYVLGVGATVGGVILMRPGTADDSTAVLLFYNAMAPVITNGSPIAVAFHANGIAYTQQVAS